MLITLLLVLLLALPLPATTLEGVDVRAAFQQRASDSLRAIAADPRHPLNDYAQLEIGLNSFSAADYAAARREFSRLAENYPDSILLPKAQLMIGKCYFQTKQYLLAVTALNKLVADYPAADELAEARLIIAQAYDRQGNWKEAYFAYEETDLYHPLTLYGKQARLAINKLKKAHRKKLPLYKPSAEALFKKGMLYYNQDDYELAALVFNRLAREYPKSKYIGEAWLMLGRAELQTSQWPSAISDLEKATAGPPNLAGRAYYYLGLAYGRRGHYTRAVASLKKVVDQYPDSNLADDALYWIGYYQEVDNELDAALNTYYQLISKYPYSSSVPDAIWRIGRTYYWKSNFKNAATYLHMAQLYPPAEGSPRCYFFEAKALERLGNRPAALDTYKKCAEKFDHTYYGYRAEQKLNEYGISLVKSLAFNGEDFYQALSDLSEKNQPELSAIMEIWEQSNSQALDDAEDRDTRLHLAKYKELMNLGLVGYAADEARYLVNVTTDVEKESVQTNLAEMLVNAGEYRTAIRFADRRVKNAVLNGKAAALPKKIWTLAYPRPYWKQVAVQADRFGLDPFLVLAVIREESRFNSRAVSRSGARGLMQIMPRTGRGIAQRLELEKYRTRKLFIPALNIEMGTYYLSNLVGDFDRNVYLALAGYNGGPNRIRKYVKSWYNGDLKLVDIDEFVESIPNRETRLYVQKVMGSYFEYKRLYERKRG